MAASSPTTEAVKLCAVESCDRRAKGRGRWCSAHYERHRLGKPLEPPVDDRYTPGQSVRTHRQALRELCRRVIDLGVVESEDEAVGLVISLAANWPQVACDVTGAEHGGASA
jgi:hypothetical protein